MAAIDSWHRAAAIGDLAHIVVMVRPGAALPATGLAGEWLASRRVASAAALADEPAGRVWVQDVTALDVSSTAIRAMAARGASTRYLLPDAIATMIAASGCYMSGPQAATGS